MVLHTCHDHAMSGGHLAYKQTFDRVRDRFGGRCYITTSKLGAMTAKHVNGVNHRIVRPNYLQAPYPLLAHSNVFQ